jgi:hypothetical protein
VRHDLGQLGREEASLDDHVTSGKLAFERVVDEVLFKRRGGFNWWIEDESKTRPKQTGSGRGEDYLIDEIKRAKTKTNRQR